MYVRVAIVVFVVGEGEHVGVIVEGEGGLRESEYVHVPDVDIVIGCAIVAEAGDGGGGDT